MSDIKHISPGHKELLIRVWYGKRKGMLKNKYQIWAIIMKINQ